MRTLLLPRLSPSRFLNLRNQRRSDVDGYDLSSPSDPVVPTSPSSLPKPIHNNMYTSLLSKSENQIERSFGWSSRVLLGRHILYQCFEIGAGPELNSSRSRGKIMGFSFSVHWICNFLVGLFFLDVVEKFGVAPVYCTFGAVSLLAAIFSTYFIVETKGLSLEEIELSLNSNSISRGKR